MHVRAVSSGEFVCSLDLVRARHVADVGAKAANLGELLRARLPVPRGFCITTAAFRAFLAGAASAEAALAELARAERANAPELTAGAERVRAMLAQAPVPDAVAGAIARAYHAFWVEHPETTLAVRSSATAEDLPQASFAGQFESYLGLRGVAALLEAVRNCWVALYSQRAVLYQARQGIDARRVAMAVLVQELVPAESAGVVFTAEPRSGDTRRIVIEATAGMGAALVAGRANPQRLELARADLSVIECCDGQNAAAGGTGAWTGLAEDEAQELGKLALRVEQALGGPQDVEWARQGGKFWLVQARPVTALGGRGREYRTSRGGAGAGGRMVNRRVPAAAKQSALAPAPIVWSNVNVGELLPQVATPMTWSVLRRAIDLLFRPLFRQLGLERERETWLALIAGRVYANLSVFERFVSSLPGPAKLDLGQGFGGHTGNSAEVRAALAAAATAGQQTAGRGRWRRWWAAAGLLLRLPHLARMFLAHTDARRGRQRLAAFRRQFETLACVDPDAAEPSGPERVELLTRIMKQMWGPGGGLIIHALAHAAVGLTCMTLLGQLARRWLGDEQGAVTNRLVSGAGGMASAEAALGLWRLADWVRQRPTLVAELERAADYAVLRGRLERDAEGRELLERWTAWSAEHGHHAYGELDVALPRWAESPDYVLGLLRGYLATPPEAGPITLGRRRNAERAQLLGECRARLGFVRGLVFEEVLRRARGGLVLRENFKSEVIRVTAGVRRLLLTLGGRLTQHGVLHAPEDIFFFELDELPQLCAPGAGDRFRATVERRRAEYGFFRRLKPPPVIVGRYEPTAEVAGPRRAVEHPAAHELRGLAVSPGVATGPARVLSRPDGTERVRPGEILVAPHTDPGWTPQFLTAAAIVTDLGGLLSHGSIVAREYGLPAVVNVGRATELVRTGQILRVDGGRGIVTILPDDGR